MLTFDRSEFAKEWASPLLLCRRVEHLPSRFDDFLGEVGREDVPGDGTEDFPVKFLHRPLVNVWAGLRPLVVMPGAGVEERPSTVVPATPDMQAAAAHTPAESRQEILRVLIAAILPAPMRLAVVVRASRAEPPMHGLPHVVRDDPQVGSVQVEPLRFWTRRHRDRAFGVSLPGLVPHDFTAIEGAMEDFVDARRTPSGRARLLRTRCERLFLVQKFRDP
ncbi:MAG TPA: hypothetical protein VFO67_08095 [Gemmatimonadales bacterium]|nr:hypothetical protein [Gemmatimonadales bacterium]